jgi:glycine/D-amino acid oxidase-like deaminating enzyme
MSPQKEIVVVGAGVTGCSIAYHLAKRGAPSQVIERDAIAARASGKSWAIFAHPTHFLLFEDYSPDLLLSMPKGSLRPWLDLFWMGYFRLPNVALGIREEAGIDIGLSEFPMIQVAISESEEAGFRDSLSRLRNEGYCENSWIDANELRAIWPEIDPRARGGLCLPCFQFEPYRYVLGLVEMAEKIGVNFRQGEVVGFRKKGPRVTSVVLATGTEVNTDIVILTMGPWTGKGTSWLGKEIPIKVNREQCLRVEVPERLPPYGLMASTTAIFPKANGEVILGFAGEPDLQPDPDGAITTEDAKITILSDAVKLLPRLGDARLVEHRGDFEGWGLPPRAMQPVLGRLPDWDNVYIAARMGTLGQCMSLGVGHCMADLILGEGRIPYRIKNMMELLSPARLR